MIFVLLGHMVGDHKTWSVCYTIKFFQAVLNCLNCKERPTFSTEEWKKKTGDDFGPKNKP